MKKTIIFESKIGYNNIDKSFYNAFNHEKSTISKISYNEWNNIILNNEYSGIYDSQLINSIETIISRDEFEENNEYNFTIDDTIKGIILESEINILKGKKLFNVKTLINRGRKRINLKGGKNNQKKHKKTDLDNIILKLLKILKHIK